jgi:hypothetical protein
VRTSPTEPPQQGPAARNGCRGVRRPRRSGARTRTGPDRPCEPPPGPLTHACSCRSTDFPCRVWDLLEREGVVEPGVHGYIPPSPAPPQRPTASPNSRCGSQLESSWLPLTALSNPSANGPSATASCFACPFPNSPKTPVLRPRTRCPYRPARRSRLQRSRRLRSPQDPRQRDAPT